MFKSLLKKIAASHIRLIGSQINKLKRISVPEKGHEGLNGLRTTTKLSLFVIIFNMVIAMISDCHPLSCTPQT